MDQNTANHWGRGCVTVLHVLAHEQEQLLPDKDGESSARNSDRAATSDASMVPSVKSETPNPNFATEVQYGKRFLLPAERNLFHSSTRVSIACASQTVKNSQSLITNTCRQRKTFDSGDLGTFYQSYMGTTCI